MCSFLSVLCSLFSHVQMCQEASLGPIRELGPAALRTIRADEVRALNEQVHSNCNSDVICCVCVLWME